MEEKERHQKEEKLNKADKNIAMAMEELNNYRYLAKKYQWAHKGVSHLKLTRFGFRQRAEEMEDELKKTKQSYDTQISAHEKKAHNNWVRPREPFISTELKKKKKTVE